MPLFRRRAPQIDYQELAKALTPAIAHAATVTPGPVPGATYPASGQRPDSFAALPRGPQFNSLFGPGVPLLPDPLDPLGATGRTTPRRSEYLVAWNLELVDRQVPWTMLRWLAEDCDLVSRCVQLTQDEQCGLDWNWTFSPQLLHQIMVETGETSPAKATQYAQEKYGAELLRVQRFFDSPDRDMNQSFVDWLQALLWDHLVYDGVAIYPRFNMDGSLRNLELIDASTVKLLRDNAGRVPRPPAPAYQQVLYGFPRGEFQHTPDGASQEFEADQLAYFIRRPRNTTVYGFPQVEEVMALATTYLARQAWMRAEYTHGVTPRVFIETSETESWTPEQMAWFEQVFNDRLQGQIERRQTAFLLRPGMQPKFAPQTDEHYRRDYDDWLVSQIASRFGRPPTMLGVQARAGLSGGRQMEGEMNQADIYSGKALTRWVVLLLNTLAYRYLGAGAEITASASGGTEENELAKTQAEMLLVNGGVMTRNESRSKRNLPLIQVPEADQLAVTTGEGVTFLSGLMEMQEANLAAAQATAGGPTAPDSPKVKTAKPAPAQKAAVKAAGLVVKARDTGRVLMVQRGGDNHNQQAAGHWEWPGGRLDAGETAFEAAQREWVEEVGLDLPDGKLVGQWEANDGAYVGFVWVVKHEADVDLSSREHRNPDDDDFEAVAWWDPTDIVGNSAVRAEVQSSDWGLIGGAKKAVPKAQAARKAAQDRVAQFYSPRIRQAMAATYPDAVRYARTAVHAARGAVKATPRDAAVADVIQGYRSRLNADLGPLTAALAAMHTDAWVVGTRHSDVDADTVSVDAGDWQPGWALTADVTPPAALQVLLDGGAAARIAGGVLDRITSTLSDAILSGASPVDAATDVQGVLEDSSHAETVALSETADAVQRATHAAYAAAGVTQWRWVLDGEACALCESLSGVHDLGDRHPPAHPRCGCGSEPVKG